LIKKCLPILCYAIGVCLLNKAHINSLEFAVGGCFSKNVSVKSRENIAECMQLFNCQSVKHVAEKRRYKYFASRNGFCNQIIRNIVCL